TRRIGEGGQYESCRSPVLIGAIGIDLSRERRRGRNRAVVLRASWLTPLWYGQRAAFAPKITDALSRTLRKKALPRNLIGLPMALGGCRVWRMANSGRRRLMGSASWSIRVLSVGVRRE